MALTATEEAQVKALIAQNAALLSLASSEPTIISKLAATKVSLADLIAASTVADSDLFLVRQGSTEKSVSKAVLASGINAPDASESVKGILEIATAAEAQGFTANKAIDGAKLAAALQGANQSLTAKGYQKLPGGLIVQWGKVAISNVTESFAIPFPNACFLVAATNNDAQGAEVDNAFTNSVTTSNFFVATKSSAGAVTAFSVSWFAIGY